MKRTIYTFAFFICFYTSIAQQIKPGENLIIENIPAISNNLVSSVKNYTESRGAGFAAWHPTRKEMIISTRFANSNQLHYVSQPLGMRKQITFFDEPLGNADFEPINGNYFLFTKDAGGNEFGQIFSYSFNGKIVKQLTGIAKSQNGNINWNPSKKLIAYSSTQRNGADRDFWIMNPTDSSSKKIISENTGGGWSISEWFPDEKRLLVNEGISANESRLYILDIEKKTKTRLLPEKDERTTYEGLKVNKAGTGIFLITNKDNEFNRLAFYDFTTKKIEIISNSIPWDIESVSFTEDESKIAFCSNENGISKLYIYTIADKKTEAVSNMPVGIISGLSWHNNNVSLALTINDFFSSSDVFVYEYQNKSLVKWTESELGMMDLTGLSAPELIRWKSFDGKEITGFYYKPNAKYTGKRPVIINIHGGPEGQSRPTFLARGNYYLNEMGIAMIFPNVRGSSGYGKTFLDADNGYKREESVKDIGALIDWIAQQPDLDKDRIMITGGSYGGYMTLACSFHYADKIRCSLDVVGISNFNTFLKNTEAYRRDLRRVEYGDERDPKMYEFLEKISPLNHIDKIKKPLFIVQGENDPRVPASEAIQMKDKIKNNGGEVWFLMAKDEGHGFRKKNNVDFQFYSTIEFIKKYLIN